MLLFFVRDYLFIMNSCVLRVYINKVDYYGGPNLRKLEIYKWLNKYISMLFNY